MRLSHRFYYFAKPVLPWQLRMTMRRLAAQRTLKSCAGRWPINLSAGQIPASWPGWPNGKRFAVVLTHDVEGPTGLSQCEGVLKLEQEKGFRSSFNFIPEGDYRVTPELRALITRNGFEVGVHDLKHDGKLFHSRADFHDKAARINHYLREWGASGYRSGFMLRNLSWLQDLDIRYDSSTFDTDPFEPQPDGTGTIFPFWVPSPAESGASEGTSRPGPTSNNHAASLSHKENSARARGGYVELPYTLPQDSTLFLLLREMSPDTWIRKADWIAQHGGMILLNVHPDYLRFPGNALSARTYPVEHYSRLLDHINRTYAGQFWQALPREVAEFTTQLETRPSARRSKRICMLTHSFYESDNRVTRYAESLAARGDNVDVVALRRSESLPQDETIEGVHVFRIQDRLGKKERSRFSYLWPMVRFLWLSSWWITRRNRDRRYDLLHVHNMPDFLVFAAWHPRLTGARIILDIHDIVPEFYTSKFKGGKASFTESALKFVERCSAHFSHHIIVSNQLWLEKYQTRTKTEGKCSVFINNVDSQVFRPRPRTRHDSRLVILFPGGLQWHQGLDIALRAFQLVSAELPHAEFHIYGDGNMKPSLVALAAELGFNGNVKFFEPVGVRQVSRLMADADLGVVPKRADSFGNEAYSTKIMEFMSCGVPVVISKTKIDQYYFNDSVVRFFESGNHDAMAAAMVEVLQNGELRKRMTENASVYAETHSWHQRKGDYLRIVDSLVEHRD